ncbi:hypothetical protein N7466_007594 [Penicillium verhagenii]|uniref:uncharacterized protein n=1 Tax=Penicillium verhagenii TaxID=1562060 RepID=UPI002545A347|nr:uncharacterized protein N7466_007594 [Penicillium verhagenii]KAJ5928638.1 hypothetical protein N7466_007594 [Penicillium verhagenii]
MIFQFLRASLTRAKQPSFYFTLVETAKSFFQANPGYITPVALITAVFGTTFSPEANRCRPYCSRFYSKMTETFSFDWPAIICLVVCLGLMPAAYFLTNHYLPASKNKSRARFLFAWHAYDALTHLLIEGSFLWECFTSWAPVAGIHSPEPFFLNKPDRVYGPAYGTGPSARLWQEYAKADRRWAGADITVVSLELLTVLLGGPAAIYICYLIWKVANAKALGSAVRGGLKAQLSFAMTVLATAELYGGFMTFAPEWLTGSTQLATHDFVYKWVYLVFFNGLWVCIPLWVLRQVWVDGKVAFVAKETAVKRH